MFTGEFYDEVYRARISVVVGSNKECVSYVKKRYFTDIELDKFNHSAGKAIEILDADDNPFAYVIWVRDYIRNDPYSIAIVMHEIQHVLLWVFETRHIKIKSNNPEPVTYYMEYLTREVFTILKKSKRKK